VAAYKNTFFVRFQSQLNIARTSTSASRPIEVASRIEQLERDMQLLCVTGVEDKSVLLVLIVQIVLIVLIVQIGVSNVFLLGKA
jgi:hypothetical protein